MTGVFRQLDATFGRRALGVASCWLTVFGLAGCGRTLPTAPNPDAAVQTAEMASAGSARTAAADAHDATGVLRLQEVEMDIVQYRPGEGDLYDLNQAIQLLDHPGDAPQRHAAFVGTMSFSDQEGACCVVYPQYSLWEDYVPLPGTGRPAPEQFVVRFRGQLIIPRARAPRDSDDLDGFDRDREDKVQSLTLAVASDDGFRLRIINPRRHRHAGDPAEWSAEFDAPRGIAVGPLLPMSVPASGGRYPFELIFFERGGGAILHLAAAAGIQPDFSNSVFQLMEAVHEERGADDDGDHDSHSIARNPKPLPVVPRTAAEVTRLRWPAHRPRDGSACAAPDPAPSKGPSSPTRTNAPQ